MASRRHMIIVAVVADAANAVAVVTTGKIARSNQQTQIRLKKARATTKPWLSKSQPMRAMRLHHHLQLKAPKHLAMADKVKNVTVNDVGVLAVGVATGMTGQIAMLQTMGNVQNAHRVKTDHGVKTVHAVSARRLSLWPRLNPW